MQLCMIPYNNFAIVNPIQGGLCKKAPYQFFPCYLNKRRNYSTKLTDFYF